MTPCFLEDTNLLEDLAAIVLEADHENGGKTFLRNVGKCLPAYSTTLKKRLVFTVYAVRTSHLKDVIKHAHFKAIWFETRSRQS